MIAGMDWGTHNGFIRNSAPIDGANAVRSLAAIGRALRFPLDVELSPSPPLNNE